MKNKTLALTAGLLLSSTSYALNSEPSTYYGCADQYSYYMGGQSYYNEKFKKLVVYGFKYSDNPNTVYCAEFYVPGNDQPLQLDYVGLNLYPDRFYGSKLDYLSVFNVNSLSIKLDRITWLKYPYGHDYLEDIVLTQQSDGVTFTASKYQSLADYIKELNKNL